MKIEQDEKIENLTDEQMLLDLTVCNDEISFLTYFSIYLE
jgi:hypothetical protein